MIYTAKSGAAPHPAAATFSPYSDGEKGLAAILAHSFAMEIVGEIISESVLLPVTIWGEVPGRAMRGGAGVD
ncbi:hypothetical protein X772_09555 [Mesorhizobium sp. LSJC280B00]|nr:hypothetical protein X772_09555 [Mesorhizobium sp. LSJC280B00]